MYAGIPLVALLFGLCSCGDDLGLERRVFRCDADRPCAEGHECVDNRCVAVWQGPMQRVRLRLRRPAEESESALEPCARATLCYTFPGEAHLRGCIERLHVGGPGELIEFQMPLGLPLCAAATCDVDEEKTSGLTGRTCRQAFGEAEEIPVFLMPARTFGPVPDLDTGGFASPEVPRRETVALALRDGCIIIAGGRLADGMPTAVVEIFYPSTLTFTTPDGSALAQARAGAAGLVLPSGKIAVFGGAGEDGESLASVEIYDPASATWSPGPPMSAARAYHTVTDLDGKIILAGGKGEGGHYWELWEPGKGTVLAGLLKEPRWHHTATAVPAAESSEAEGPVVVLAGGEWEEAGSGIVRATIETVEQKGGQWVHAQYPLCGFSGPATPRTLHAGAPIGRQVFVFGGYSDSQHGIPASDICGWDLDERKWEYSTGQLHLLQPCAQATTTILTTVNGAAILVAGGVTIDANGDLASVAGGEWIAITDGIYNKPVLDVIEPLGKMHISRWGHEAVAMQDGRVFLFGGLTGDPATGGTLVEYAELFNP